MEGWTKMTRAPRDGMLNDAQMAASEAISGAIMGVALDGVNPMDQIATLMGVTREEAMEVWLSFCHGDADTASSAIAHVLLGARMAGWTPDAGSLVP